MDKYKLEKYMKQQYLYTTETHLHSRGPVRTCLEQMGSVAYLSHIETGSPLLYYGRHVFSTNYDPIQRMAGFQWLFIHQKCIDPFFFGWYFVFMRTRVKIDSAYTKHDETYFFIVNIPMGVLAIDIL